MSNAFSRGGRGAFGGGNRSSGTGGRAPASAPSSGNRRDGERNSNAWVKSAVMYDPWHSALEAGIVADLFQTSFYMKLAPVFGERRGPDEDGNGRKYNYDETMVVALTIQECIVFRAQLEAFINGHLAEVIFDRTPTKRIRLEAAEVYYDQKSPEYELHAGGLVICFEDDGGDRTPANNIVFISRQVVVSLSDTEEPVALFPELQALLVVIDSYLGNCARVDFASVRAMENRQREERPAGTTAPQPTRRGMGGATAKNPDEELIDDEGAAVDSEVVEEPVSNKPVRRGSSPAASRTTTPASSRTAGRTTVTPVATDDDIDNALLGDLGADAPKF